MSYTKKYSACKVCGVELPGKGKNYFCSEDHRKSFRKDHIKKYNQAYYLLIRRKKKNEPTPSNA